MTLSSGRLTSTVAFLSLTLWIGGLITLGAIVAPVVFASAPHAIAADAMTAVFARFDKLAMACAAVLLATEALRARASRLRPLDVGRALVSIVLAGCAALEGLWVTPKIVDLHASGAMRGVGEAGASLDHAHALAEQLGKGQAVLAIVLIALHVLTLGPREPASSSDD